MSPEELAQEANQKIKEWVVGKDKLVVAIDGYTGSGKTTLLNNLVKLNSEILPVHFDDFLFSRKKVDIKDFELGYNNYPEIEKLVNTFRISNMSYRTKIFNADSGEVDTPVEYNFSKQILVIDGIRMFHPKLLNHLWDRRVYLDGDTEEIDKRRVEREKKRWGDKYFPETHPDSHFKHLTIALKKYREEYKPEQQADFVLR
jgi:uridine kinase